MFLISKVIIAGVAIIIVVAIIMISIIYGNHAHKKRMQNITELLQKACEESGINNYKLEQSKKNVYDFHLETDKHIYYIKVVNNSANQEICVNNAIKWQLRKHVNNDQIVFLEGIEGLMRLDLPKNPKKQHKLFIIYPNARALLKVINECEMVFVYPETDVYGANIVTYIKLSENPKLLDL